MPRAKPFRLVAPVVPEHPFQKQVCDVLRLEIGPPAKVSEHGVLWFSIDHANYAGEVPGIRIGRGITAGILDMFVLWSGLAHFIELKTTAADARLSEAQQSVAAAVLAGGGRVGVATSTDHVLACLDTWRIPRKHRVH